MKPRLKSLSWITLALVLFAMLAVPMPALAALGISSVSPDPVVNHIVNVLTVSGSDFDPTAEVSVGGTPLATTFVDSATLTAVLPAGFLPGVYTVTVTNPGPVTFDLPSGLTVLAPTPTPSPTPTPTVTPLPFSRPQMVVLSYYMSTAGVRYGQEFNTSIRLYNAGYARAYGVQVTFTSVDLLMLRNGGLIAVGNLESGGAMDLTQFMTAASLAGRSMVSADMNVSYYDGQGVSYTDKFTLNFPVASTGGSTVVTTPTPKGLFRSQLVITHYETDIDPLQPGLLFQLTLTVKNMGNLAAKGVTMIVGGGSTSGSSGGTPQSGGVSGGSGEFSNFAPVGTSNIQSLGDFPAQASLEAVQQLVVNVSTNPGAYPMKITFTYVDERGNLINDEQVITLLVYSLPQVEVGFYQPLDLFFAGQPGLLPLQVVNMGKKLAVLGNMKVEAEGALVENGEMLIGPLDMAGYFPLDATIIPGAPGPLELVITIEYTDDFNQPRTITKTLTIQVEEYYEPMPDPNAPGIREFPVEAEETFWQKVWRFILGLLGLDSGVTSEPVINEVPVEEFPLQPIPAPANNGKG